MHTMKNIFLKSIRNKFNNYKIMKKRIRISVIVVCVLFLLGLCSFVQAPVSHRNIYYQGEIYYYCDGINDTTVTPDGSLQVTIIKVYNHFGCEGISKPWK